MVDEAHKLWNTQRALPFVAPVVIYPLATLGYFGLFLSAPMSPPPMAQIIQVTRFTCRPFSLGLLSSPRSSTVAMGKSPPKSCTWHCPKSKSRVATSSEKGTGK